MVDSNMAPEGMLSISRSLLGALDLVDSRGGREGAAQPLPALESGRDGRQRMGDEGPLGPVQVERIAEMLNRAAEGFQRKLHFQVDEASGRTEITVLHAETGDVIRRIPLGEAEMIARHQGAPGEGNLLRVAV